MGEDGKRTMSPTTWDSARLRCHVDTGPGIGWIAVSRIEVEAADARGPRAYVPVIKSGLSTNLAECRDLLPKDIREGIE